MTTEMREVLRSSGHFTVCLVGQWSEVFIFINEFGQDFVIFQQG